MKLENLYSQRKALLELQRGSTTKEEFNHWTSKIKKKNEEINKLENGER